MLEFRRPAPSGAVTPEGVAATECFTLGLVMDAGEQYRALEKGYFVLPGRGAVDVPALTPDRRVRPRAQFRDAVRALPGSGTSAGPEYLTDVAGYRARVRQRLGPLPESFHRLLAKGLEFKPMGQVRDFVFNYLLEPVAIQTAHLVADLENYKALEQQAEAASTRVALLERVCTQGAKVQETRRQLESHRYVALRADWETKEATGFEVATALGVSEAAYRTIADQIEDANVRLAALRQQLADVQATLAKSETAQSERRAKETLATVREQLREAREAHGKAQDALVLQRRALDALLAEEARGVRAGWVDEGLFPEDALFGMAAAPERIAELRATLEEDGYLDGHALRAWADRLETARKQVDQAGYALNRIEDELQAEDRELRDELARLDAGRVKYPDGTEALLHLLKTKLVAPKRAPQPLCELLEVTTDRWRNAVEGMLGPRRYDVLVAADDFTRAAQLYERHREGIDLPRRGRVAIHGVSIPDIGRIREQRPVALPGSLAEHVRTDDPDAQALVNFHLGHVMCCEEVADLRKHRTAITPTVMIYQSFSVRHPDPRTYRVPALGLAARERRRTDIEERLAGVAEDLRALQRDREVVGRAEKACARALGQVETLPILAERARERSTLEWREREAVRHLENIDTRAIAPMLHQAEDLQQQIDGVDTDRDGLIRRHGEMANEIQQQQGAREKAHTAERRAREAFYDAYDPDEPGRWQAFEQTYARERAAASPSDIYGRFENQRKGYETRLSNETQDLVVLKSKYNEAYGEIAEVRGEGFDDYRVELAEWQESKLPEYRARMVEARANAVERLAEDVISQLGANFQRLEREFTELNRALKDVRFGSDRYRFTWDPTSELAEFYKLVTEASRYNLSRDSLFGDQALPDHLRETLDGMVARLLGQAATEVKTDLERLTDYREYFRYDIRIEEGDGALASLDASSGGDSGGETQTPYYVAILSSMLQMYRSLLPDRRPRAGLVLLDEAFSKLDGPRIRAVLQFMQGLGLQVVLATPGDKVEHVAPRVETCLLVHKDASTRVPAVYDCTREWRDDAVVGDDATASGDEANVGAEAVA
jgi:hypothetical protein